MPRDVGPRANSGGLQQPAGPRVAPLRLLAVPARHAQDVLPSVHHQAPCRGLPAQQAAVQGNSQSEGLACLSKICGKCRRWRGGNRGGWGGKWSRKHHQWQLPLCADLLALTTGYRRWRWGRWRVAGRLPGGAACHCPGAAARSCALREAGLQEAEEGPPGSRAVLVGSELCCCRCSAKGRGLARRCGPHRSLAGFRPQPGPRPGPACLPWGGEGGG
mmetsp:Transcript_23923/g.66402  ORF Transcript_23923/g.66402 Transcript_23923/m.66402 type:complete len:217 (-) Transcript_23923:1350-2000(-)